ncbi:MAG: type III pantothenate kinase [Singulisphaera sp.]
MALSTDDPAAWAEAWELWNPAVSSPRHGPSRRSTRPRPIGSTPSFKSMDPRRAGIARRPTCRCGTPWNAPRPPGGRACGVVAAVDSIGGGPGLVVSCGTAITVDRIAADGTWQGGDRSRPPPFRTGAPPPHAAVTRGRRLGGSPGLGAFHPPRPGRGVFWGVVGSIRELLERQATDLSPSPWLLWTGEMHRPSPLGRRR